MKKAFRVRYPYPAFQLILTLTTVLALSLMSVSAEGPPLLPEHREFLENVSPIMTKFEREVFQKLKGNDERSRFIQFFWKQRDPQPDTNENEFYKEYMERVRYADGQFGRGTSKRGSQTERGFFYLVLGPPLERSIYATQSDLVPQELWFYQGEVRFGLPAYFYLIFYQPVGMGEYRLYSPGVEGPEKLVVPSMSQKALTRTTAIDMIKKHSAELARASVSYIPGEQPFGTEAFSSDNLLASVRMLPEKKFSDVYARNYLNYKDYVETEYMDAYTESAFRAKVFRGPAGAEFVHWSLEPGRMNFAAQGDIYYASFEVVLRVEDLQGRAVYERTEEIPLRITPEQYEQNQKRRFAFQDVFPLMPGEFRVMLLLKNKTGKDFTSQEFRASVPQKAGSVALGPLLLYRAKDPNAGGQGTFLKAFAVDGAQYFLDARNEFPLQSSIGFYIQPFNLDSQGQNISAVSFVLEVRSADTSAVALSLKKSLAEVLPAGRLGIDIEPVPLASWKPGYYEARASLLDAAGRPLATQKENFILLTQGFVPLPWVYSRQYPGFPSADHLAVLGSQHLAAGDFAQARDLLDRSLKLKDRPGTRLLLAKVLYGLKSYKDSLALANPVFETTRGREAAKLIALSYAGLNDWSSALVYLEEILREATEVGVLNLAAECHIRLNEPARALPLLQKSLEIDPNQSEAKALEEQARKSMKKVP